LFEATQKAQ